MYSPIFAAIAVPSMHAKVPGLPGGGDLEDFYPDVCVEGLEKDPF